MSTPELLAVMKAEIQTLEQFDRIGNAGRVAMKYGIDHADAHLYRKELEREAEELVKRNNNEARAKVAKMKTEITTVAEFKAIGRDKDVAAKYDVAESSAGRLLTELRQAEGITGNTGWLKSRVGNHDQPVVTAKPEAVTEPKPTVLITPEIVHQVDNGVLPLKELKELFKEKPEPDLSKFDPSPVLDEKGPLMLAMDLVAKVRKELQVEQSGFALDKVRKYFADVAWEANRDANVLAGVSGAMARFRLEMLKEIECGVITALNGRESV